MKLYKINELMRTGYVPRYHTNVGLARFGQTNADHQGRVTQLIHFLFPDASKDLLIAALFHDAGEYWVGDMPGPAKRRHPEIAERLAEIEKFYVDRFTGDLNLSKDDQKKLKLVDQLEACLYCQQNDPEQFFDREWQRMFIAVLSGLNEFGVKLTGPCKEAA